MAGATKSLLLETQMLVIKLAGAVNSRTTLVLEIKMLTIMKMAGPAEAEVVEDVVALTTTKVEIVLSLRAASNAVRKVTFQENVLILAEVVGEVHQEVVVASSAARRVTWLVTVPAVMQVVVTTILRVGVVVEEELLAAAQLMSAIASSARERVISREIALTITVKAMLSPTRDRGAMKMVVLTAEEVATTTMLHPLATVVSGETILHLLKTRVHSGEHQPTKTPMPTQTPGEILTTATTTRLRMIHGGPATTMMGAAAAGTEQ